MERGDLWRPREQERRHGLPTPDGDHDLEGDTGRRRSHHHSRSVAVAFTKLDAGIVDSTIWDEPPETCKVWITMLAKCDADGVVAMSVPGLANASRLPIAVVEQALSTFMSPDGYSRTKDHDGRRIEEVDGGWRLLNYKKYRAKDGLARQRELTRKRVAKHREKQNASNECNVTGVTVTPTSASASASDRTVAKKRAAPEKQTALDTMPPEAWALARLHRELLLALDPEHTCGGKRWSARRWASHYDAFQATGCGKPLDWSALEAVLTWALGDKGDGYWHDKLNTPGGFTCRWDTLAGQYKRRATFGRRSRAPKDEHLDRDNDDDWAVPDGLDK